MYGDELFYEVDGASKNLKTGVTWSYSKWIRVYMAIADNELRICLGLWNLISTDLHKYTSFENSHPCFITMLKLSPV